MTERRHPCCWPESDAALVREVYARHLDTRAALDECCRLLPHRPRKTIGRWVSHHRIVPTARPHVQLHRVPSSLETVRGAPEPPRVDLRTVRACPDCGARYLEYDRIDHALACLCGRVVYGLEVACCG